MSPDAPSRAVAPRSSIAAASWVVAAACAGWGAVLLVRPNDASDVLSRLVGVGLLLLGAAFLVRAPSSLTSFLDRVDGMVWAAIGLGLLVWPDPTVRGAAVVIGVALVGTGVVEVVGARRGTGDERVLTALGGSTSVGFGLAALTWPSVTTLVLSIVVGGRLLVAAIDLVLRAMRDRRGERAGVTDRPGWRRWPRRAVAGVGLLLAIAAVVGATWVHRAQPGELSAFYDAPDEVTGVPGTVVRTERVEPSIDGATTYRVLYETSDLDGDSATSSGLVIVPDGPVPPAGRPVMAFTHGTVGIDRRCALSALPADRYVPSIPGIREMLDAGFVVAATDYAGLGTEGMTGYLVGASQAYSAIDSVRVAVAMPETGAAPRFVVFGESQGGQAALFTGQLAASYAPELELVGVAAAAPATDLTELLRANAGTPFGDILASYALASWRDVYGVDIGDVVTPRAIPVVERIARLCIQTSAQILSLLPEAQLLRIDFLAAPPWETEPWKTLLLENTPGGTEVDAPVIILQGANDPLVRPEVQQAFVVGWCARGQPLEYRVMDGVGHLDAGAESAADVVDWLVERLAGDAWSPTVSC